ncbi:EAL domain-containing protein [Spiroplasma endosymbiont of Othius punctulatus]|uniref:EAL domain-containing protein n=1 Tax=Spiroplasma endosymbiont of Othius punctulatus TaxID=3066289 RepID=UPI0030CD1E3B
MEQILFKFLFNGLLYVTIILLVYALVWGFTKHLLQRFGKYYHVAIGIVLSALSLFMTVLFKYVFFGTTEQGNEFLYLFQVLYFWVAIVFISNISGIMVGVTNCISMFYLSTINGNLFPRMEVAWFYILITVIYLALIFLSVLRKFFTRIKPWMIWTTITTGCLVFIFIRFFSVFSTESNAIWEIALVSIWLMLSYVLYAMIALINRLHMSAVNLQNTITYENQYYVNNASANEVILKNVQSQNISYAIYFTFFIADVVTFEKSIDKKLNNEIIKNITDQVYNLIVKKHQNAVFFKRDYRTFGAFIPLMEDKFSLSISDEFKKQLKEVEESYNAVNLSFKYENLNIDLKLKNVASFFGLHSNNLEILDFYNKFHQEREVHLRTEQANVINIDTIQEAEIIRHQLNTILEQVPLNTTEVTLNPIYDTTTKSYEMYLVDNIVDKINFAYAGEGEIEKRLNSKSLVSLLKRHLITISLERLATKEMQLKNSCVFLKYDHQVLASENFDITIFKNSLKTKVSNWQNLYLGFDASFEIDDFDVIKKNIKHLKNIGIKTFVYNFGRLDSDLSNIAAYQPTYVFLSNDIAKKCMEVKNYAEYISTLKTITDSIEAKIVATNINRYNEYKKLKEINIELFTGKLFGQFENPTEISESLLYLLSK